MLAEQLREETRKLIAERDKLESEIRQFESVLRANGSDLTSPLVDDEGFPKADLDLPTIRSARNAIIRLRNDHKKLTDDIEASLHRFYAQSQIEKASATSTTNASASTVPFARVNAVAPDSPASAAGLERGDQLLMFENVNEISLLPATVSRNENKEIKVLLERANRGLLTVTLVPRKWSGKGLLGCHIVPI
ncbi:hypothetical protein M427DRAFT_119410 [Gonapodya prolifera JEL478]|uniref:Probable 26S proteasome regulatory subunit p27 n=1 Tax=Gonapodya prolifera (strain JEL478) TaxID=1344416 RepID=A0A139AVY7_GONPJ|nr:hypothetical protein M427DRAFT_119410 [Gonapodya prolifera JEL478]|eukprot:KXS20864.1 hypothetical protein M427DRAFT_119410 [Gonapodya prolifera JEL478]